MLRRLTYLRSAWGVGFGKRALMKQSERTVAGGLGLSPADRGDRLGHVGYLVFYALAGVAASLTQIAIDTGSVTFSQTSRYMPA